MEGITRSILLLWLMTFTNANMAPEITKLAYPVCEDTPTGDLAFTIEASDPENDPLTYQLTGINAPYFTVDRTTGAVYVRLQLDRDKPDGDVMPLGVIVSDGSTPIQGELTIILQDANDNKPIFVDSSYNKVVPENTPVDTSLFRVQATDLDTGTAAVIRYSIEEVIPSEGSALFAIVATTGVVSLKGPLTYTPANTFYRLKIKASDGGGRCATAEPTFHSSDIFAIVTVEDVADRDPQFVGLPYTARVEENSPVGKFVIKVIALDQDTGVNDIMIYSLESTGAEGLFTISPDRGEITVLSPSLDREVIGDTVTLTVKATETNENIYGVHASTTATVEITILDINDNEPEFYKCEDPVDESSCVNTTHFTGEVVEHRLGSVPINMFLIDLDKTSHTELLLEGEDKDVFSVEPKNTQLTKTAIQFIVKDYQKLDFEVKQQMVVQVIAIDKTKDSFRSTATVTIKILDDNDNSPEFPKNTYDLEVDEHSPAGTIVANITAYDPDTMDQGNITYSLLPQSILSIFGVEQHTGVVYVKSESLLDRETKSVHSVTLQARDTAGQVDTTVLEITVTDINDQPPVMNRDFYLEYVKEGQPLKVDIQATDADEPNTPNSKIVYAIVPSTYSDNFTIDPDTGVLRNSSELDREALDPKLNGRIELNVTATDSGTPPLSTFVIVTIDIEDVNDNTPQFEASFYSFSVKEGERGAYVGSVHAKDLDQTTIFNRISFSIVDGSYGSFVIRTFEDEERNDYRGSISVDQAVELDYESVPNQFTIQVEAADLEGNAEVNVQVNVLDVNDERPEFKPTDSVTVKENTIINEPVGHFTAIDKDGNHSLVYEQESVTCRCKNVQTPCNWFTVDSKGQVWVNPKVTVDYEACDQVVVKAQVVDEFTEKGRNNSATPGEMVINIEDINDNAPEFIPSDTVFVALSESASKDTSVAEVSATDRDSGVNRQIDFKVTTVKFQDLNNQITAMRTVFEAKTTQQNDIYTGIIQTTEALDKSLTGKYLVTVSATDTGGLSNSTVLDIFTMDQSYKVELRFAISEAQLKENLPEIERTLMDATMATIKVYSIHSGTDEIARASEITIMEAYFVYANGTALTPKEVEYRISQPDYYPKLSQFGLRYIGDVSVSEPEIDYAQIALLGMIGILIIVLAALTTSLLCTRRKYRRKLKAAKAMNSASMVNSDNQKSGPVVPGTNKYTMEGANPVLNLNIDSAIALDLDGESSDVDKVSLNSLDYSDDMILPETGTKTNMLMIQEEEEDDGGPPKYIEPLGAALAQRGQKKTSDKSQGGLTNPAFDTTDL